MKKVILFPGQGSQYRGMGKSLFAKYATETRLASGILGYDIEALCLKDPNKLLNQTQFTQPALYIVNSFLYKEYNQTPDFLIGHSLGEYNALLAAGAFDFETGLRLVQKRGALMAAASGGGMAAVLGLTKEELAQKLETGGYDSIDIANYNTPSQIVLSGTKQDIEIIIKDFSNQNIRIIPLNVSAPFHSRYMAPAAKEFAIFLKNYNFNSLKIPVISNVTALPYQNGGVTKLLSQQIDHSVQWINSIRYLMGQSVTNYEELGRGILTKMANEIRTTCSPINIPTPPRGSFIREPLIHPFKKEITKKKATTLGLANNLGSAEFREDYGISYSYLAGAMYKGIASKELVIRLGKAGMMGYLGTGGMSLEEIANNIGEIQATLTEKEAYGMNFIHYLSEPEIEFQTVELYLKKRIKNIEASAFMQMTESLVYYHASGLEKDKNEQIIQKHRILAKVSRPEVAEAFMRPASEKLLYRLLDKGKITEEQVELAKGIPVSYDICVEADSGGHTDAGVAMVLLPAIQRLRNDLQKEFNYKKTIRVGLAGGIGTPQSVACAFVMGADFVLTGSINQCTVEAGTSEAVKDLLEDINVQDTAYAPAGDMFEIGAKVQVLRKGVLFHARANKLYSLYNQYNALEEIPAKTIHQLERNYFKKSLEQVWEETKKHLENKGQILEIKRAEQTPKHKMALVFRWYFGYSSRLAFSGDLENKVNFQIHTGPALGAFNQWVKGTELEDWRSRHVDKIGIQLMTEAAKLLKRTLAKIVQ